MGDKNSTSISLTYDCIKFGINIYDGSVLVDDGEGRHAVFDEEAERRDDQRVRPHHVDAAPRPYQGGGKCKGKIIIPFSLSYLFE